MEDFGGPFMIFNMGKRRKRQLVAAEGYLALDMPDQALSELAEISDPGDTAFEWHQLRGEALRAKQDHRRALECFQRAHELRTDDLGVLMSMAWCFKRIGSVGKSIEVMRLAYQAHPDVPVVLYNLACYYSLVHDKDQALSWLGRALRMDQDFSKLIPEESDFDPLRHDEDFQHLLQLSIKQ
jgi:tetratricopeptide (TPR) repeat protein